MALETKIQTVLILDLTDSLLFTPEARMTSDFYTESKERVTKIDNWQLVLRKMWYNLEI